VQTRRHRCAQHGDGTVDILGQRARRTHLPAIMPSTGCAQEKVLARMAVHNGRKLSTLGISRATLDVRFHGLAEGCGQNAAWRRLRGRPVPEIAGPARGGAVRPARAGPRKGKAASGRTRPGRAGRGPPRPGERRTKAGRAARAGAVKADRWARYGRLRDGQAGKSLGFGHVFDDGRAASPDLPGY